MNKLISYQFSLALGLLFISSASITTAQVPSPSAQPSSSQLIWGCRAENETRIYEVDQLKRDEGSFDMAIYERRSGVEGRYIGTAQVNVSQKEPELIGSGETFNSTFTVAAFGRTVAFNVQDSVSGSASGQCAVQWRMADRETRRLVRQCLALAASIDGFAAALVEHACTNNPESYIEELQRRR